MKKSIVIMVLFSFLGCSKKTDFSYDSSSRPGLDPSAQVVAKVLVFKGKVTVSTSQGKTLYAKPGLPLLGSDRVTTPDDGFAVLQLANRRLLRVDAKVTLLVKNAAGMDLGPTDTPIQEQLTQFLSPKELGDTERIVGWHARMTAAQSVNTETERTQPQASLEEKKAESQSVSPPSKQFDHKSTRKVLSDKSLAKPSALSEKSVPAKSVPAKSMPAKSMTNNRARRRTLVKKLSDKSGSITSPGQGGGMAGPSLDRLGSKAATLKVNRDIGIEEEKREEKTLHIKIARWIQGTKISESSPPKSLQDLIKTLEDSPCLRKLLPDLPLEFSLKVVFAKGHLTKISLLSGHKSIRPCLAKLRKTPPGSSHENTSYQVWIKIW